MTIAYHFTSDTLRDGSPIPPIGQPLVFKGPIKICSSGFHASKEAFDALRFAPGKWLHQVECKGIEGEHKDKLVCRQRTILKTIDSEYLLRRFAADRALSVIHLWAAPQVVKNYLETLDEGLRDAARDTAWYAARGTAWYAARAAARAAARDAARAAARAAARDAARAAARAADRDAAWDAAKDFNSRVETAFENVE